MITQKLLLPFLLMLITDGSALFYLKKDHKHQHSHEEVDHHHHHYHHHHHHDDHKHHEHKHKPQHEYNHHYHHVYEQKQPEHKHHEHKQMHKHEHDNHHHYHHGHEQKPAHKHHEHKHKPEYEYYHHYHHVHEQKQPEHKHHEHKQTHKHEHDNHHHYHHGDDHTHDHHKYHEHHQEHKHQSQPLYEFKYGVRDPNTGDIKNQWEMRKGDEVQGEYSLVEADGTIRTVRYTAGKHTGFNAIVKKEGKAKHPIGVDPPKTSTNFQIIKPVHQEQDRSDSKVKGSRVYTDGHTSRVHYHNLAEFPTNHKPVFSGIDEETNLLALYKKYPVHRFYNNSDERGTVYGISEYLTKRSYDLSKITDVLNASPVVDPIRVARGSFAMGR